MMSSPADSHPSQHELRSFLLGRLARQTSDEVEAHVAACTTCLEQLDQIDDDPLVSLLQYVDSNHHAAANFTLPTANVPIPLIPGYESIEEIGRGGMGIVYRARHVELDRLVALKTLPAEAAHRSGLLHRLQSEAQALARLQHPNIVAVFEVGEHEGLSYIALEFIDGLNLDEHLAGQALPSRDAAELLLVLAQAMHSAHQRGIIHRDLKPSNVIIDRRGTAKIADFGLAKHLDSETGQTRAGMLLGTPQYMAPEQAQGSPADTHIATDVYGLGGILYRCLTGRAPFQNDSTMAVLRQVVEHPPTAPRTETPGIARDLETICLKCLQKEPDQRYSSAAAVADDLRRFLNGQAIAARPVSTAEHVWMWSRRNPALATLGFSLLACVLLGAGGMAMLWRRAEGARTAADHANTSLEQSLQEVRLARERASDHLYASRVSQSYAHYLLGNTRMAWSVLQQCQQDAELVDRQGWEWSYVHQLCHDELERIDVGNQAVARDVRYSADGRWMVFAQGSFGRDSPQPGKIVFRDVQTGRDLQIVETGPGLHQLALSNDGRLLAATSRDQGLQVWRLAEDGTATPLAELAAGTARDSPVRISQDSRLLAFLATEESVAVRDLQRGSVTTVDPGGRISAFDFTSDGYLVVAARGRPRHADGDELSVWDPSTGQQAGAWMDAGRVTALRGSPRNGQFAVGSTRGTVSLYEVESGQMLWSFPSPPERITEIGFSPTGRQIAVGTGLGEIRLLSADTHRQRFLLKQHEQMVNGVSFLQDGSQLATSSIDGTIRLWDLTRPPRGAYYPTRHGSICLGFRPDSRTLAVVSPNQCRKLDSVTGEIFSSHRIAAFKGPIWPRTDYALSPDARSLAVPADTDPSILRVYDTDSGSLLREMPGHRGRITAVAFGKDGGWIASAALVAMGDKQLSEIKIRNAAGGEKADVNLPAVPGHISVLCISADGSLLAAGHPTASAVRVFDLQSGQFARELAGSSSCWDLRFDPRGGQTLMAADRAASRIYLWNAGTGALIYNLPGPAAVTSACFSPDGRRIAAVGQAAEVHLYDAVSGEELISLASQGPATRTIGWTPVVVFSPDGRQIASKYVGGHVDVWTAPRPSSNFRDHRRRQAAERLPFWHLEQAHAAGRAGDLDAAAFHLACINGTAARGMDFWLKLAEVHGMLRQADQVEAALSKAVEAAPADPSPWYKRGKFHYRRRNWLASLSDLEESGRLFPVPPVDLDQLLADCRSRLDEH